MTPGLLKPPDFDHLKDQQTQAVPVPVSPGLSVYLTSCDISLECLSRRVRQTCCMFPGNHTHYQQAKPIEETEGLVITFAACDIRYPVKHDSSWVACWHSEEKGQKRSS